MREGAEHVSSNNRRGSEPIFAARHDGYDNIVTSNRPKGIAVAITWLGNEFASIVFDIEGLTRRNIFYRQRADPSDGVPADGLVNIHRFNVLCNRLLKMEKPAAELREVVYRPTIGRRGLYEVQVALRRYRP
jgi:hypothetical protein